MFGLGEPPHEPTNDPIIYLVDDDPLVRKALSRLLRASGHEVVAMASAAEYLEAELENRPSCLVLDVHMPGVTGLELLDELNRCQSIVPVVFITGYGDIPSSVRAMKSGAVEFLEKPVDDADLLRAIDEALARHRQRRGERAEVEAVERRLAELSSREREVLELVITGMLNKQVAGRLGIAEKTVKVHRARVMAKMEVESLAELVRTAAIVGIHGPDD